MIKKIICKFLQLVDSFARARAAAVLTRSGHYEAAKNLMDRDGEPKC
jgi:hypothetical protein